MEKAIDDYTNFVYMSFTIVTLFFILCAVVFVILVIKRHNKRKKDELLKIEELKLKEEENRLEELRKFEEFKRIKQNPEPIKSDLEEPLEKSKIDTLYLKYCAESLSDEIEHD